MDVREELREVEGGRRLAHAEVRPLVDAFRNRPPPRERPRDVAAVHLRVHEAEPSHERVDARAAAARRASEQHLELVGGDIVRVDESTVQETVCIRARRGLAGERPQRLDRDCELERRSGRKARAGVPGRACPGREVADVDGAGAREGAHQRNDPLRQPAVEMRHCSSGSRGARQAENMLYRGPAVSAGERRRRHGHGDVAARQRHANVEAAPAEMVRGNDSAARSDHEQLRAARRRTGHMAERDLVRRGCAESRRRKR
jgi:hypothetical protein